MVGRREPEAFRAPSLEGLTPDKSSANRGEGRGGDQERVGEGNNGGREGESGRTDTSVDGWRSPITSNPRDHGSFVARPASALCSTPHPSFPYALRWSLIYRASTSRARIPCRGKFTAASTKSQYSSPSWFSRNGSLPHDPRSVDFGLPRLISQRLVAPRDLVCLSRDLPPPSVQPPSSLPLRPPLVPDLSGVNLAGSYPPLVPDLSGVNLAGSYSLLRRVYRDINRIPGSLSLLLV